MMRNGKCIATPPGATISEQLTNQGMNHKEFAQRLGMSQMQVNKLINGEVQLTPEIALKIEEVLGVPAKFWNNLEAIYRENFLRFENITNEHYMELLKNNLGISGEVCGEDGGEDSGEDSGEVTNIRKILEFCRIPRTKEDIRIHLGIKSERYVRENLINVLIADGRLVRTLPEKLTSPRQKYIIANNI